MSSETKKILPNIANYLPDNEREIENNSDNTTQVHTNYAEWKRLKKNSGNLQNVRRSVNKPLADISSCEEDYSVDDNTPIFKITNHLADKEENRRRNENLRRQSKEPSHFLLFSRMKQRIHFDCSFSDLCQITHASWANMDASENEELVADIGRHIHDYKEAILRIREVLLPNYTGPIKITKPQPKPSAPIVASPDTDEPEITLTLSITDDPGVQEPQEATIPERLQNLAGDASVYFAPEKPKRINNPESKSEKRRENDVENCNFPDCENRSVDDYRWNGQYCSAKCLIKDCQVTFNDWLSDQKSDLTNGDECDQDIILCLESPPPNGDQADIDLNLMTACNGTKKSPRDRSTLIRSDLKISPKKHYLVENSPDSELDDFGTFLDTQAGDFVT